MGFHITNSAALATTHFIACDDPNFEHFLRVPKLTKPFHVVLRSCHLVWQLLMRCSDRAHARRLKRVRSPNIILEFSGLSFKVNGSREGAFVFAPFHQWPEGPMRHQYSPESMSKGVRVICALWPGVVIFAGTELSTVTASLSSTQILIFRRLHGFVCFT
jgi:hypothetical protein